MLCFDVNADTKFDLSVENEKRQRERREGPLSEELDVIPVLQAAIIRRLADDIARLSPEAREACALRHPQHFFTSADTWRYGGNQCAFSQACDVFTMAPNICSAMQIITGTSSALSRVAPLATEDSTLKTMTAGSKTALLAHASVFLICRPDSYRCD